MFSGQVFWDEDIAELSRMLPDCGDVPVSALQVFADPVVPLIPPDKGRIDRFDNNEVELRDSRIGEFSVLSLGICDPSIDMNTLDGDELVICPRDVGISDGDAEWICLLYSASSGSAGDISVAVGLDCKGLDHWRGIVWDPYIVGKRCLHVCYDCLCLIALFRDAMILVHDWAALFTRIGTRIGYCRTITWELGCLGSIHLPCDVDRFFGCDVWQIK